jgi:hypothetical protein
LNVALFANSAAPSWRIQSIGCSKTAVNSIVKDPHRHSVRLSEVLGRRPCAPSPAPLHL